MELAPGAVHLRHYLSLERQRATVVRNRALSFQGQIVAQVNGAGGELHWQIRGVEE